MTVLIDLLYVAGCPNLPLARRRLQDAVARAGSDVAIREREITDQRDAQTYGMVGSPTILVDGRDAVPGEGSTSVSCRLYATDTGSDGAPTVEQLVKALAS